MGSTIAKFPKNAEKIIDIFIGPVFGTFFLVFPGLFAAMWSYVFFLGIVVGIFDPANYSKIMTNLSFGMVAGILALLCMGLLFPIGCASMFVLWRLVFLTADEIRLIKRETKLRYAVILILASALALWVVIGMPGFDNKSVSFRLSFFTCLLGPVYVGLKYAYFLRRS